ncbi:energy-coupling factor transporter transmembrane component T [Tessaracoccus oleiagri]|uniref:Energy-coupling factor transport system permease protein n=1 Tax=Tessaracoccus oleiagri TaxID=686624 RepID=A0A1G9I6C9_9ACTN|nr:energy-coupling factor transporter transmembrane component T [Tessaracoccus oleiagri]SDL20810.1 energy-coupling factor transport system permease protein [Tessaracoccus oleiagri]
MADGLTSPPEPNRLLALHPFTQVGIAAVLAVAGGLFSWPIGLAVAAACFALAATAGKLGPFFKIWWKTILILSGIILLLQTFFIGGETPLVEWWIFTGTEEGFQRGLSFAGRVIGVGSAVLLLVTLLDINRLVLALEQRGVNPRVTYIIMATANIIPEMGKQMNVIMDAQRARGIETDANMWVRAQAFVPTIGPLLLSSIVGVEEKALTLESRGFSIKGKRTSLHDLDDPAWERKLRLVLILAIVALFIGGILLWVL